MIQKHSIEKIVRWLCRQLCFDELLLALQLILEVAGGRREDIPLKKNTAPIYPHYRQYTVDPHPPLTGPPVEKEHVPEQDYKELLAGYRRRTGRELKPVSRRSGSRRPPPPACCPQCHAPSPFLYVNDGRKQNQLRCKVCGCLSPTHRVRTQSVTKYWCPHCGKALYRWKSEPVCTIFKCGNRKCPCRRRNLEQLNPAEHAARRTGQSSQFKLCYQYREYHLSPADLLTARPDASGLSWPLIRNNLNTVGLVLTYSIYAGLSSRMTAQVLRDVHGIPLSHQTVMNYLELAANRLWPLTQAQLPGVCDNLITGDETYIHVAGAWDYSFFVLGTQSKAILAFNVSAHRDAPAAIATLAQALMCLTPTVQGPADLARSEKAAIQFVGDGNPAYDAAVLFLNTQPGSPKLTRRKVIGLTNQDPESETYRPFKQLIERLNRTYKFHTRARCGFKNINGAVVLTTLFVVFYNFLRPHSALTGRTPVTWPGLNAIPTIQGRWAMLLQ
jgi:putative transposase